MVLTEEWNETNQWNKMAEDYSVHVANVSTQTSGELLPPLRAHKSTSKVQTSRTSDVSVDNVTEALASFYIKVFLFFMEELSQLYNYY